MWITSLTFSPNRDVMLLSDFNGKIYEFRKQSKASSNRKLLEDIIETTEMKVINTGEKCTGTITSFDKSWNSVIDYALVTEDLYAKLKSMVIDEDRYYSIDSEHNVMVLDYFFLKDCKSSSLQNKPCMGKWNINDNTIGNI